MLRILLIDDDKHEKKILTHLIKEAGFENFNVEHVTKCAEALNCLSRQQYDFVLLDNALSDSISATFSVPFVQAYLDGTPLAVISNNIDVPHLRNPDVLGVDYIVGKDKLTPFMRRMLPILGQGFLAKRRAKLNIA